MTPLDQLAFDHSPIGVSLTEDRVIKSCNQTFCDVFGYEKAELINQSFQMLYTSRSEFEDIRDIGLERLRTTGAYTDERIMQRRDGSRFWCRFRAHTLTPTVPLGRLVLSFAMLSERSSAIALTVRERQVVLLLSRGLTSKEIARELGISPRTVEDVRSRLLKKFTVRNVAELLARLVGVEL